MLFMHWLNYGLICVIEISSSNFLMYRQGGKFNLFIGVSIITGIMRFIADCMMIRPDAPDNIIGRGCIAVLNKVFHVDLPEAIQKMKHELEFCMSFRNSMSLLHLMNFSYLQRTWDAANLTLQDLMSTVVDRAVNPTKRNCPICLDPILSRKLGIPACGHPMHMKCWKVYLNRMNARSQDVKCPVCDLDTQGYCYQVQL
jgi:hypothetical protein